jgi:hypothetical protein
MSDHGLASSSRDPAAYDVFISYASEDRTIVAQPLAEELDKRGLRIWFDEIKIQLGDSLRRSIDEGLTGCRFAVVVLSPRYFAKEWTQYELDGLVSRQTGEKQKIILPVWHEVDSGEVRRFSPKLADLKAALWSLGVVEVADLIMTVVRPPEPARGSESATDLVPTTASSNKGELTAQILDTLVRCGQCKQPLSERSDLPPGERRPCPVCGSTSRAFEKYLHEQVGVRESVRIDRTTGHEARPWLDSGGGHGTPLPLGEEEERSRSADQPNETRGDGRILNFRVSSFGQYDATAEWGTNASMEVQVSLFRSSSNTPQQTTRITSVGLPGREQTVRFLNLDPGVTYRAVAECEDDRQEVVFKTHEAWMR